MGKSFRIERLNDAIKELISELIHKRVKDPRIGFVTILSVDVAADLTSAKVYYSVMGSDEDKAATLQGLESAAGFFRRVIGKELKLRYSPELRFTYDHSLDKAIAIDEKLREIREEDEEEES